MLKFDIFLSHNSADKVAVELLAHRLREEVGLNPFLDKWHLIPGEPWQEALEEALDESATVAVFVGPSGVSPWHNEEMRSALDSAVRNRDEYRVIPVLLPGASEEAVARFLSRRTWVDFRRGLDDAEAFGRLVAGILGEAVDPGVYELPDEPAPYRGLLRFEAEHAEFFFGRKTDTQRLVEKLKQHPIVALIGASGSGKSSLVRAGLLPALAGDAIPGSRKWRSLVLTPGNQPTRALAEGLATFVPPVDRLRTSDELVSRLMARADGLRTAVTTLLAEGQQQLLLVIDQFEELFTLCLEGPERCRAQAEQFIANLSDAVARGDRRILLLITLRADFLDRCLAFSQLRDLLQDHQILLGPLDEPALRNAVVRPAQVVGAYFEKGLVSAILRDVQNQPGVLPLLQHALYELWQARRGPWLTLEAYEATAGVRGALHRRAQATYDSLTPEQQGLARDIFLRLTALGEGVSDTRRRVSRTELYPAEQSPGRVDAVLQVLSSPQARLIVVDEQNVEVAHEALIQQWSKLREWLEADREGLRIHRHLTEAAHEWESLSRDPGELYRGARLAQSLEWAETHATALNPLEREFLATSEEWERREEAEREAQRQRELEAAQKLAETEKQQATTARRLAETERNRAQEQARAAQRFRRLSIGLSLVLFIALISTGWAIWQTIQVTRQARIARSADLAAHAQTALEQYPQRSLLLAVEALAVTLDVNDPPVPIAKNILRHALRNSGGRVLGRHNSPVTAMAITPDAEWLVSGSLDSTVRLWRLNSSGCKPLVHYEGTSLNEVVVSLRDTIAGFSSLVREVTISPDGQWLFTSSWSPSTQDPNVVLQWDLAYLVSDCQRIAEWNRTTDDAATRQANLPPGLIGGRVVPLKQPQPLFPGSSFAGTKPDGTSATADGSEQQPKPVFVAREQQITALVVSKDARRLVVGYEDGTIQILALTSSDTRGQLQWPFIRGHSGAINVVTVSPDSHWLATGGADNTVRIWDLTAPNPSTRSIVLTAHQDEILSAAISSDSRWLVTGSADDTARLWDLTSLDQPANSIVLSGHDSNVIEVAFSPNNAWVVTASDDTARLWDLTGPRPGARSLVLSGHTDSLTSLTISPDNHWLVTGSQDATARLWNLTASDPSAVSIVLRGHEGGINSVAISPDSKWLMTAGDTMVRQWDLTIPEPGVALTSKQGDLTLDELINLACNTAGRNLTSTEWDLFFPGQDYHETCE